MESGKSWKFFLGCLDILSESESDDSDDAESNTEEVVLISELGQKYEPLRKKVIDAFNESKVFTNVSDLFVSPPKWVFFDPIIADIHIPVSLQKEPYRLSGLTEELPQDFKIIFDGRILTVVALCPADVEPSGVYDVRDRVKEVLSTVSKFIEIPPCLTHEAIVIFNKEAKIWKSNKDLYIGVDSNITFERLSKGVYLDLIIHMNEFYHCCGTANKIEKLVADTHKSESLILNDLKKFLQTNWREVRKRRSITSKLKKRIVEILEGLSQYSCYLQELDAGNRHLNEQKKHNPRLNEFIAKILEREEYNNPRELIDMNSTMRIIEHARSELETYITNTSTLLSALTGAVIGSVLTLVVTYLLSVINSPADLATKSTLYLIITPLL